MKFDRISRRHFLQGAGGFTLAIPFLPSLISKANAGVGFSGGLVYFMNNHGGVLAPNVHGPTTVNRAGMTQWPLYQDHLAAVASLEQMRQMGPIENSVRHLSPMIGPAANQWLNKLTLFRGFCFPVYMAHHHAPLFGNIAGGTTPFAGSSRATIDTHLARPNGVLYRTSTPAVRQTTWWANGPNWAHSYGEPVGGVAPSLASTLPPHYSTRDLFLQWFPSSSGGSSPPGTHHVDLVRDDYNRLRNNSQVSADDRFRLDQFIALLFDLQNQLQASSSCMVTAPQTGLSGRWNNVAPHGGLPSSQAFHAELARVTALAFACGATRTLSFQISDNSNPWVYNAPNWTRWYNDYHQEVGHGALLPNNQAELVRNFRFIVENVFLPFVREFDAISSPQGGTLLDHSLIMNMHEHGPNEHGVEDMPILTAGGVGEFANFQGRHIDVSRRTHPFNGISFHGVLWHRFLATVLQSFGMNPSVGSVANPLGYKYLASDLGPMPWITQGGTENASNYQAQRATADDPLRIPLI